MDKWALRGYMETSTSEVSVSTRTAFVEHPSAYLPACLHKSPCLDVVWGLCKVDPEQN